MRTAVLTVGHVGSDETWTESYTENDGTARGLRPEHADVEKWAHALIDWFNETAADWERKRRVVSVEVTDDGVTPPVNRREHDWEKTNAITISDRQGVYDAMRCRRCGVTGKRFGLTRVKVDSKFRAKKWQACTS